MNKWIKHHCCSRPSARLYGSLTRIIASCSEIDIRVESYYGILRSMQNSLDYCMHCIGINLFPRALQEEETVANSFPMTVMIALCLPHEVGQSVRNAPEYSEQHVRCPVPYVSVH